MSDLITTISHRQAVYLNSHRLSSYYYKQNDNQVSQPPPFYLYLRLKIDANSGNLNGLYADLFKQVLFLMSNPCFSLRRIMVE